MTEIAYEDILVGDLIRATDEEPGRIVRDWTFTVTGKMHDGLRFGPGAWDLFPHEADTTFALLERPLAGWEAEVLAAKKPEPETLDAVPGMVIADKRRADLYFTVVPGGYWDRRSGVGVVEDDESWNLTRYTVVFDPRDAPALPSPLGIRVGDTVRREVRGGVTVEFVVDLINDYWIHPAYGTDGKRPGVSYNPDGFTVVSREVPDRLPAGTITRARFAEAPNDHHLRTEDGWIVLDNGKGNPGSVIDEEVRQGILEVIYLP